MNTVLSKDFENGTVQLFLPNKCEGLRGFTKSRRMVGFFYTKAEAAGGTGAG